jgi:hypothetical protein
VQTNIKKKDLINYLYQGVKVRSQNSKLETLNVPVEGAYQITRVRTMSVILPDSLEKNVKAMQKFIYGSAVETEDEDEAKITVGQ